MNIIFSTQRPSVNILPNDIKLNCAWTIAGRVQTQPQSLAIVGSGVLMQLPDDVPGRMYFMQDAYNGKFIQTPHLPTEKDG